MKQLFQVRRSQLFSLITFHCGYLPFEHCYSLKSQSQNTKVHHQSAYTFVDGPKEKGGTWKLDLV